MSENMVIRKGPTRISMDLSIGNRMAPFMRSFTKTKLTDYVFDPRWRKFRADKSYTYYDASSSRLYLPVNFLPHTINHVKSMLDDEIQIHKERPVKPRKINLKMNPGWVDRPIQVPAIEYLTNENYRRKGLQLQTGMGKSRCSIKSISILGQSAIIIAAGLVDQWVEEFHKQSDIGDRLYVIRGFDSLDKLFNSDLKPDVFVCSLQTLRPYVYALGDYAQLPIQYPEFQKHYGIGVKVMDEVHLNFHAMTQMDLRSKIRNNIYLTATFNTSRKDTRRIFNTIYPERMRFGAGTYKRYVKITFYAYLSDVAERKVVTQRGYSHSRFENQITRRKTKLDRFVDRVLKPVINAHYIHVKEDGEKMLIYFALVNTISVMQDILSKEYPDLNIVSYTADDPEEHLEDGVDIILTTHKSAGVGTDISNLRTVLNTVSLKAPTVAEQILGRLRELKNGATPEFIDIYDPSLGSHTRHYRERAQLYKQRAKEFRQYKLY